MFLTSNEQASGYPVKSLTSKLAGAVANRQSSACPSGPHFIHDSVAQAGVKCSKGNFTMAPFVMNFSSARSQLELLFVLASA